MAPLKPKLKADLCSGWSFELWTTLHNLVVLFERVGAEEVAAVLLGAASTASTGAQPFGADAERMGTVAAALRQALGDRAFTAADTRGRCMSDEQVVACALGEIDSLLAAPGHPGRG